MDHHASVQLFYSWDITTTTIIKLVTLTFKVSWWVNISLVSLRSVGRLVQDVLAWRRGLRQLAFTKRGEM